MKLPKQVGRKRPSNSNKKCFLIKIRPQATAEYLSDMSPKSEHLHYSY